MPTAPRVVPARVSLAGADIYGGGEDATFVVGVADSDVPNVLRIRMCMHERTTSMPQTEAPFRAEAWRELPDSAGLLLQQLRKVPP